MVSSVNGAFAAPGYDPTRTNAAASPRSATTLLSRIAEARREGWLGEVEGLQISLAAARGKLTQLDELSARPPTVQLGMPSTNWRQ